MLPRRYERTGDARDLSEAIQRAAKQVVASTLDDLPDKAVQLNKLGCLFLRRYERTGDIQDFHESRRVTQ